MMKLTRQILLLSHPGQDEKSVDSCTRINFEKTTIANIKAEDVPHILKGFVNFIKGQTLEVKGPFYFSVRASVYVDQQTKDAKIGVENYNIDYGGNDWKQYEIIDVPRCLANENKVAFTVCSDLNEATNGYGVTESILDMEDLYGVTKESPESNKIGEIIDTLAPTVDEEEKLLAKISQLISYWATEWESGPLPSLEPKSLETYFQTVENTSSKCSLV